MSAELIKHAADLLRAGELVAFPTETVYGLGADATNGAAVTKIFAVKGRPSTNPLIVHVADKTIARHFAQTWDDRAEKLATSFWPGPLTLVLPKVPEIVPQVTAGLSTVGLRVPKHPIALQLLRTFGGALAAPSANRSNRISPTTAQHVRAEFGDAITLILDGGPCTVGIESTVLDLSDKPRILRPGAISREMIQEVLGEPVEQQTLITTAHTPTHSPGQLPVHYAPTKPAFRFDREQSNNIHQWHKTHSDSAVIWLSNATPEDYAHNLYAKLRDADTTAELILIEMPPDQPAWTAIRDRITRATKPIKLSDLSK
ncbi:MAG TPA: L-threonylcarbamoyladenylate synthase [Tepidisphaeraceae bacterium]